MSVKPSLEDVAAGAVKLPLEERLQLLDIIHQSLATNAGAQREQSSLLELRGFLKTDAPPPSDDALRDDYTDYLIEKYS
ncbi:MAG: hypothetical protein M3220_00605 [Chloroflexota bacterium]|nr:hypothetical protein [Chloroflexota bacterium]